MTLAPTVVRRALLSVSDKTGIVDLARELAARDIQILSTGGTARTIREAGLPVTDVSEVTGFPEIMDGRVKTLHPKIHGGILGRRGQDDAVMAEHGITGIDLVVLNLYPFEQTIARPGVSDVDAIENIDIGGPAMLRAAAKNHAHVTVVVDPADYAALIESLPAGGPDQAMRRALAAKKQMKPSSLGFCVKPARPSGHSGPLPWPALWLSRSKRSRTTSCTTPGTCKRWPASTGWTTTRSTTGSKRSAGRRYRNTRLVR